MTLREEPNPTLARRQLAVRFRNLRKQFGQSLDDLAALLGVAQPQASRLDTGARGFREDQVAKLAERYRLDETERAAVMDLVVESRGRAWWQQVDLPASYRTLIGMEQGAESINEYGGLVVPGLLQTPDYARAVVAGDAIEADSQLIEPAVEVRMRRQRILDRAAPPKLGTVIDEAVLARTTGGAAVMSAQLDHLLEMSERPGVTIKIVGFERGIYPGLSKGHFILIDMGTQLPDVLYREGIGEPEDKSDEATLVEYWKSWRGLQAIALDPYTSRARVRQYRSRIDSS